MFILMNVKKYCTVSDADKNCIITLWCISRKRIVRSYRILNSQMKAIIFLFNFQNFNKMLDKKKNQKLKERKLNKKNQNEGKLVLVFLIPFAFFQFFLIFFFNQNLIKMLKIKQKNFSINPFIILITFI